REEFFVSLWLCVRTNVEHHAGFTHYPEGKWRLLTTLHDRNRVSLPPFDAIVFDLSLLWAD
ncbi:MAG: hypothetical protein LGR52_01785, partial [Candidatus Thiosymbion ectosymbiont of Robbea hypermnestra]|nr:hypothetical protein [Candidatus Thiosymbion ectosymbiont of Robbea hypermnestra]